MMDEIQISPMPGWNPQDSDPPTPIWHTLGWAQCMGNSSQNDLNFVGMIDPAVREFAKMNTFTYYAGLETWLKQLWFAAEEKAGRVPTDAKFKLWLGKNQSFNKISELQATYMNEVLVGSAWRASWKKKVSFQEIWDYLDNRRICSYAIDIPRKGQENMKHLLNGAGKGEDENGRYILTLDSYGNLNTNYKDKNGHKVKYHESLIGKYLTTRIFIIPREIT